MSLQSLGFLWLDIKEDKKPIPEWRVVWCVQEKLRSSETAIILFLLFLVILMSHVFVKLKITLSR